MQQRRGSVGRTRFVLALSLSTVTALAVAAPLAIVANNARRDQGTTTPAGGVEDPEAVVRSDHGDLTLDGDDDSQGGIGTKPRSKAQGQTGKTGTTLAGGAGSTTTDIPTFDPAGGGSADPTEEGSSGKPLQPAPTSTTTTSSTTVPGGNAVTTSSSTTTSSTTTSTVPDEDTGDGGEQATD